MSISVPTLLRILWEKVSAAAAAAGIEWNFFPHAGYVFVIMYGIQLLLQMLTHVDEC